MKNILFLFFLIISIPSISQTFVDDVDRVAVVVIDYCVDEDGECYDIKINDEKSSYKNEGWRIGCLEHFKKGKLRFPLKMANACWQSVYHFVNSKYKNYELSEAERLKCKTFHQGQYKYENPAYSETIISRRKNLQIEKGGYGGTQVYRIKWTDVHKYQLESIKMSLEKDKHKIGNIIVVEIIELLNEKTYLYKAHFLNKEDDTPMFGIITKI